MAKLLTDVYVDGVLHAAGSEAPRGVSNPAALDAGAWAVDSLDPAHASTVHSDEVPGGPPPRNGAGSGRDAWKAYADTLGLEVADDATRDDIVAAVEAAES